MHIALITTTINVPTVLKQHVANVPDDCTLDVVVAGDVQTPPDARALVESLGGTYLGVDDELVTRWASDAVIGHRSIQRRNVALLHALTLGPDVVVTIDDDNFPRDPTTYLATFVDGLARDAEHLTTSSTGWYNPGVVLNPPVVHRGFPLDRRREHRVVGARRARGELPRVGVVAGLWFGDPDVDALERITIEPHVVGFKSASGRRDVVLDVGTWAPFNTQNTALRWDVAPLLQCLVGVGRYDDVLASYFARRVMDDLGWHVRYGYPVVDQRRNDHDLVTDLERELWGYRFTPLVTDLLRRASTRRTQDATPLDCLEEAYSAASDLLTSRTNTANETWLLDARYAVAQGERARRERDVA